jgi:tRNA dimethylallyltransferase
MSYNCIVILGPTASGKTKLACQVAKELGGEIISADSRQVYKHLDIGTGKDLNEYVLEGQQIPYHLIDLVDPNEQYYLHQFINDLEKCFLEITSRNKVPIICGGTGLYLDALHKDFSFAKIEEDFELRAQLEQLPKETLIEKIKTYPQELWQHVDLNSKKRIIRGIEICESEGMKQDARLMTDDLNLKTNDFQPKIYKPIYFGIDILLEERKQKITQRLTLRLDKGLVEEVQTLLKQGITHARLKKLGLEYKFVSMYLLNEINKDQLFTQLQTAIFQFAKRQMTWFRKMEKEGIQINWINLKNGNKDSIQQILQKIKV